MKSSGVSQSSATSFFETSICARCDSSVSRRFGCLISLGAVEQRLQRAVLADQQRRGLDADPGRAGDVVGGVTGQRLHVDHPIGIDAELLEHALAVDPPVLHRVEHLDPVADQLHQVLVGRDDGDPAAGVARAWQDRVAMMSSASNPSVSLQAMLKAIGGLAGQRDLRRSRSSGIASRLAL